MLTYFPVKVHQYSESLEFFFFDWGIIMDILKNFQPLQRFMPNFGIRPPRGSGASTLFHDQQKMRKFSSEQLGTTVYTVFSF
jgi:hypothetical protein